MWLRPLILPILLGFALFPALQVQAENYILTRLGLYDADHSPSSGPISYIFAPLSPEGYIGGISYRNRGTSAWAANMATGVTKRIGLIGPEYLGPFNTQESSVSFTSGHCVSGLSSLYTQSVSKGQVAWVADARTGVTTPHWTLRPRLHLYQRLG